MRTCIVVQFAFQPGQSLRGTLGRADLLQETLAILKSSIEKSLREAQEQGELAASKSPCELSLALTNAVIGLAVTGKLQMPATDIRQIYHGTLSMLD